MKNNVYYLLALTILSSCLDLTLDGHECPVHYIDLSISNQTSTELIISYQIIGRSGPCSFVGSSSPSYERFIIQSGELISRHPGTNQAASVSISIISINNVNIYDEIGFIKKLGRSISAVITFDSTHYHIDFN